MGWVVKSLHGEALAALTAAGASGLLRDAERDARRIRRGAARDAGQALAALTALETLGLEARERVRAERMRLRAPVAAPVVRAAGGAGSVPSPPRAVRAAGAIARAAAPAVRAAGAAGSVPSPPPAVRAPAPIVRAAGSGRRRGRASMRESPVVELFRRT